MVQAPDIARHILNLSEVAMFCGVPVQRVLEWIDADLLTATAVDDGSYRITAEDFSAFLSKSDILNSAAAGGAN
jgi:hypothetical protein